MTAAEIRQKPPRYSGRQRSGSLEFSQQYQNRIITKRQVDGESEQTVEVKGKEVVLNRLRVGNRDTKGTKR